MTASSSSSSNSLVAEVEHLITRFFYARGAAESRQRCYALGLQSPLWLWTHHTSSGSSDDGASDEQRKALTKTTHLLEWLLRNGAEATQVAVMLPLPWKAAYKASLAQRLHKQRDDGDSSSSNDGGGVDKKDDGQTRTTATRSDTEAQQQLPVVLAHHELTAMNARDRRHYSFDVVIYVLGLPPRLAAVGEGVAQEAYMAAAAAAAQRALVLCADAGWLASALTARWPQWRLVLSKLREEQPPVSYSSSSSSSSALAAVARASEVHVLPSLVGASLPLCCGQHVQQRQLEYGLTSIVSQCRRLCLRHYECARDEHVCEAVCHATQPAQAQAHNHTDCPYACGRVLPCCGHACLLTCASRCNCYEVIERELPCSHEEVLGLDKATLQPIYGTVHHIFRGVCADAALPCVVEYTTECARCLGAMRVRCADAAAQQHTHAHRTLICPACTRLAKELRAQLLGEVLCRAEVQRRQLRVALERSVHQQRKAAASGLYTPGVRVEIVDASKCVPPLLAEEDFPGVRFVDLSGDPVAFATAMTGAYGTYVSSHVDVMDRSELRNLVRLPDGQHVLVADGGLRLIRALTSSAAAAASSSSSQQQQQLLLLTDGKRDRHAAPTATAMGSTALVTTMTSSGGGGEADDVAYAQTLVGSMMYLAQPATYDGTHSEQEHDATTAVSDKVVRVEGLDPAAADCVMVSCTLVRVFAGGLTTTTTTTAAEGEDTRATKLARVEAYEPAVSATADSNSNKNNTTVHEDNYTVDTTVLHFSAPLRALESLRSFTVGRHVYVNAPARQLRDWHDLQLLEAMLRRSEALAPQLLRHGSTFVVTAAAVHADTPYELVCIVNPPVNVAHSPRGPCALLRLLTPQHGAGQRRGVYASDADRVRTNALLQRRRTRYGEGDGGSEGDKDSATQQQQQQQQQHDADDDSARLQASRQAVVLLVAVPFVFITPDELAEAEEALDAAAQQLFETRLQAAIAQHSEERALRNDEDAYYAQQQMPAVTAAQQAQRRYAFSEPVALPSAEEVAAVRTRALRLPVASPARLRLARARDALAAKQSESPAATATWAQAMRDRVAHDAAADAPYVRRVQHDATTGGIAHMRV